MSDRRGDMEHRIEEALMRHAGDVEPESGAWEGVQSGVRRAHRTRIVVSSVAAVALIAAGIFVVPRLGGRDAPGTGPVTTPSGTTSPSPTVAPYAPDWSALRYDEQGYWLMVPDSFDTGWFEGHAEYQPKGYPGLAVGDDTFAVETFYRDASVPAPDGTPETVTVGPRQARRWESTEEGGVHTVTYEFDMPCYTYPGSTANTDCEKIGALRVLVFASTPDLWAKFGETGEKMARSLRAGDDPMDATTYRTFQGSSTVAWDVKTWVIAQFMESRVFGDVDRGNAYLTDNAKKQYDAGDGGLDRYDPDSSRRMVTYAIVRRDGVDANSDEFQVRITEQSLDGSKPASTYTETLGVGPGGTIEEQHRGSPVLIRFAKRDNS